MSIPPELHDAFDADVRARGEQYWRERRVHVVTATHDRLEAQVRGGATYRAALRRNRSGVVALTCTCPYIDSHDAPCKHLWALVLEAEQMGHPLVEEGAPEGTTVGRTPPRTPKAAAPIDWRRELHRIVARRPYERLANGAHAWPEDRRIAYMIDLPATTLPERGLTIELMTQAEAHDGWRPPRRFGYTITQWLAVQDPEDREIAQMLLGAREDSVYHQAPGTDHARPRRFVIPPAAYPTTLRRICETGRCFLRTGETSDEQDVMVPLYWDGGDAWELRVTLVARDELQARLGAVLVRGRERVAIDAPRLIMPGLVLFDGPPATLAPLDEYGAGDLIEALRAGRVIDVETSAATELATEIATLVPRLPPVELPDALGIVSVRVPPHPVLTLRTIDRPATTSGRPAAFDATLAFDYDGTRVAAETGGTVIMEPQAQRAVHRDRTAEAALVTRLERAGAWRDNVFLEGAEFRMAASTGVRAATELTAEGWDVLFDGRQVRQGGTPSLRVSSGIDWFELDGSVDFDGVSAKLPELLAAARRGERLVTLGDGSFGVLPERWLARYRTLDTLGVEADGALRFRPEQTMLLDALLSGGPVVDVDETFARARDALRHGADATPLDPPAGFVGTLRPYQRSGLGWLEFLRRAGFGGILADDMGLGKTVQVLALLEMRREAKAGPSLAVVPRSLVFNWVSEAQRFTPHLRVLVHHGAGREQNVGRLQDYDLVITTYGTLRRDAVEFRDVAFDYIVLDEAQAIKNASTATAKAARLLRARHRIVMSGTPIENRLADLWSLFEFLNPGMLGTAPAFTRLVNAGAEGGEEGRAIVARGVRPLLLRRTKAQVATELPDRVEQTVWVDLGATERRLYDELHAHYRATLLTRVARDGMARSRMHVLEALLRLRQAACHPGLIDETRAATPSTKLDVLISRIAEVIDEGHKVLVFSQFTSFLALVRTRLEAEGMAYEYLDGRTRDRAARVERFQTDPTIPIFLVSLKAGGVGLNLTAADYVFLLDPWWNPAAEAQAIDRAHRIGQTRHVLALRLVARGTVEEKVLELQRRKQELADAIVRADDDGVAKLTAEDLRELLE